MTYELRPIAWVRSTRAEPTDDGWDAEWSIVELADDVPDESLVGLAEYSHALVVFHFDRARDVPPAPWSRRPRENPEWPKVGIFAQRAKDRPNRLGVTICRILAVAQRHVELEGLDAIDGTPVFDLKPHLREFGPRGEVRQPGFVDELMAGYFDAADRGQP